MWGKHFKYILKTRQMVKSPIYRCKHEDDHLHQFKYILPEKCFLKASLERDILADNGSLCKDCSAAWKGSLEFPSATLFWAAAAAKKSLAAPVFAHDSLFWFWICSYPEQVPGQLLHNFSKADSCSYSIEARILAFIPWLAMMMRDGFHGSHHCLLL